MTDFRNIISAFDVIIKKYNYKVIIINNQEIALIGKEFAISIAVSLEGATINYITPNEKGELIEYWFTNFISNKFDSNDRKNYGNPKNNDERINSELKVIVSGLLMHWDSMLNGDKSWISECIDYKYGSSAEKANKNVTDKLTTVLSQ